MAIRPAGSFHLSACDVALLVLIQQYQAQNLDAPGMVPTADHVAASFHGILQVVAKAVYGDEGKPKDFTDMISQLENVKGGEDTARSLAQTIGERLRHLASNEIEGFLDLMRKIKYHVMSAQEDPLRTRARFSHESPIGVYVRRCCLAFDKLAFDACVELFTQYQQWVSPTPRNGKEPPSEPKDLVLEALVGLVNPWAPDVVRDLAASRRFFDLKGKDGPEASHQRALYQMALLYYQQRSYPSAYQALEEGMRLARLVHDRRTLDVCNSLRRRLDRATGTNREPLPPVLCGPPQAQALMNSLRNVGETTQRKGKEKQAGGPEKSPEDHWSPFEELPGLVKRPISNESVQILAFRLIRYKYLGTPRTDGRDVFSKEAAWQGSTWYAIAAQLWRLAGQTDLANVYSKLVAQQSDDTVDTSEANVYSAVARAEWLSRLARYEEALLVLFEEGSHCRFTPSNASAWQVQVCKVVRDMCRHHGLHDFVDTAMKASPEPIGDDTRDYFEEQLDDCIKCLDNGVPFNALMPAVEVLALSERLNHRAIYARATIQVCDVLTHFQMAWRALEVLEERRVDELPALAEWKAMLAYFRMTQARCMMIEAKDDSRDANLRLASRRLKQTAKLYDEGRDASRAREAIRYDAFVHHGLKDFDTRNELSSQFLEVEAAAKQARKVDNAAVKKLAEKALAAVVDVPAMYRSLM